MTPPAASTCPDGGVYERLSEIERRLSADRVRWESHKAQVAKVDDLLLKVERLTTQIKMATAIMGVLLTIAGIVVPLMKP